MDIRMIMKTARSVSVELYDGGIYYTKKKYDIFLSGHYPLRFKAGQQI